MMEQLFYHFLLVFFVPGKSNPDILLHGHVRKQRIVLKKITNFPFLWLQKNIFSGIKKGNSIDHDSPFFRSFNPGNTFQGQAFPTSGSAQDADPLFFTFKGNIQPEFSILFFYLKIYHCFVCFIPFPNARFISTTIPNAIRITIPTHTPAV